MTPGNLDAHQEMPPREVLPEVPTIEKFMQLVKHNIFSIKIHIYVLTIFQFRKKYYLMKYLR